MASDDGGERVRLTRRAFLGYSGATLAVLGIPGCRPDGGGGGETGEHEDAIDVTGLTATEWIDVWRARDLVYVRIGLYNFTRSPDGGVIQRVMIPRRFGLPPMPAKPGLIVVELQPQHIFEQVTPEGGGLYSPVATNLSDASRIVLYVPDDKMSLPLQVDALLTALKAYGMNVEANAALPPGVPVPSYGAGTTSGTRGAPVAPQPLETSLELPWRLQLSPNPYARWANATAPVTSTRGRVELWHTRLGVVGADGLADERTRELRSVRAIANRVDNPNSPSYITGSLDDGNRNLIVNATAAWSPDGQTPPKAVIEVDRLILSALGGWLEAQTHVADGSLDHWIHRAAMGRDYYVEVALRGVAYPFQHKFLYVKISERRLGQPDGDGAYLWQRHLVCPVETTCTYDKQIDPWDRIRRTMPIRSITFLDKVVQIDPPPPPAAGSDLPPAFVPRIDNVPVRFAIEAVDRGGNTLRLRVPIVWAPVDDDGNPILTGVAAKYANEAQPRTDADGQRLWVAPSSTSPTTSLPVGNTTFEVRAIRFDAEAAGPSGFHPVLAEADLAVDAVRQLAGVDVIPTFTYHPTYRDHGLGGSFNPREVFLQLKDATQPITASFAAQADKLGSFVTPSFDIRGLSRIVGPVAEIDPSTIMNAVGDPGALFATGPNLLEIMKAKLFGCMSLADLLGKQDFASVAPKFVSDALHEVDRYRKMIDDVLGKAKDVQAKVGSIDWNQIDQKAEGIKAQVQDFVKTVEDVVDKAIAQAPTIAKSLETAAQQVEDAIANGDPDAVGTVRTKLAGEIDAWIAAIRGTDVLPSWQRWTSNKALPYVYPVVAGLEVVVRQVANIFERIADVSGEIKDLLVAFLRGVELAACQQVTIDWTPPLRPWPDAQHPIFSPRSNGTGGWDGLTLRATMRGKRVGNAPAGVDLLCSLEKFALVLVGKDPYVTLRFDKLQFRRNMGKKPEIDVVFKGLDFGGPLSFIETLKEIIPLDGFSDPPGVDITPTGLSASFSMGLPSVAVGMFSLENMAISASLEVPFLGDSMAFRFAFCSREKPFTLTVCGLGGTGFFALEVTPQGISALEAQLEFGAHISINLGVASGSVSVMGGIYFGWFKPAIKLSGYIRIRGEVSVLDLISASIELYMGLEYRTNTGSLSDGKVVGRAYLEIEVSIAFFSKSVRIEVERKLAGANGDPSFEDVTTLGDWNDYCAAFAAAA